VSAKQPTTHALQWLVRPRWREASLLVPILLAVLLLGGALKVALGGYSVVADGVLFLGYLLVALFVATEPSQPVTRLGRVSMLLGVLLGLGAAALQVLRILVNSGLVARSSNWPVTILLIVLALLFLATQIMARRRSREHARR
jgi:drug/metabolite transporter (DMT)-like permease